MKAIARRRVTSEELLERLGVAEATNDEKQLSELLEAYMTYEEEGEYSYIVEEEIPLTVARKLLSPRMRDLLEALKSSRGMCLSDLAKMLNRSPPNIHADLALLAEYNLVALERTGRRVVPILMLEEIKVVP